MVLREALKTLLDTVRGAKSADGRLLAKLFAVLPSKTHYPDYYEVIARPISIREIKAKLDKGQYPGLNAMRADLDLMLDNCKTYNVPDSDIYADAVTIGKLVDETAARLLAEHGDAALNPPVADAAAAALPPPASSARSTRKRERTASDDADAAPATAAPKSKSAASSSRTRGGATPRARIIVPPMDSGDETAGAGAAPASETSGTRSVRGSKSRSAAARKDASSSSAAPSPAASTPASPAVASGSGGGRKRTKTVQDSVFTADEARSLTSAIETGNLKAVKSAFAKRPNVSPNALMAAPADLFDGAVFTWSPLHMAAFFGQNQIIEFLMSHGGEVEAPDTWYSGAALAWAAFAGHVETCRLLVDTYGANRSQMNATGQVPMDLVSDPDNDAWIGVLVGPSPAAPAAPAAAAAPPAPVSAPEPAAAAAAVSPTDDTAARPPPPTTKKPGRPSKRAAQAAISAAVAESEAENAAIPASALPVIRDLRAAVDLVAHARDASGRELADVFYKLPLKVDYPEYYATVSRPMALADIIGRLRGPRAHEYSVTEVMNDLHCMLANAMFFNEQGSQIYNDAATLMAVTRQAFARFTSPIIKAFPNVLVGGHPVRVGHFAAGVDGQLLLIEGAGETATGEVVVEGTLFYDSDFHAHAESYYPSEVFRWERIQVPLAYLARPSFVMWVKDFAHGLPMGYPTTDIHLCESRITSHGLAVIDDWNAEFANPPLAITVAPHPFPLVPVKSDVRLTFKEFVDASLLHQRRRSGVVPGAGTTSPNRVVRSLSVGGAGAGFDPASIAIDTSSPISVGPLGITGDISDIPVKRKRGRPSRKALAAAAAAAQAISAANGVPMPPPQLNLPPGTAAQPGAVPALPRTSSRSRTKAAAAAAAAAVPGQQPLAHQPSALELSQRDGYQHPHHPHPHAHQQQVSGLMPGQQYAPIQPQQGYGHPQQQAQQQQQYYPQQQQQQQQYVQPQQQGQYAAQQPPRGPAGMPGAPPQGYVQQQQGYPQQQAYAGQPQQQYAPQGQYPQQQQVQPQQQQQQQYYQGQQQPQYPQQQQGQYPASQQPAHPMQQGQVQQQQQYAQPLQQQMMPPSTAPVQPQQQYAQQQQAQAYPTPATQQQQQVQQQPRPGGMVSAAPVPGMAQTPTTMAHPQNAHSSPLSAVGVASPPTTTTATTAADAAAPPPATVLGLAPGQRYIPFVLVQTPQRSMLLEFSADSYNASITVPAEAAFVRFIPFTIVAERFSHPPPSAPVEPAATAATAAAPMVEDGGAADPAAAGSTDADATTEAAAAAGKPSDGESATPATATATTSAPAATTSGSVEARVLQTPVPFGIAIMRDARVLQPQYGAEVSAAAVLAHMVGAKSTTFGGKPIDPADYRSGPIVDAELVHGPNAFDVWATAQLPNQAKIMQVSQVYIYRA
ncbi:hypothetical protein H9P43_004029 [Blastocladiella emersonii ATCC 22665]|nr:hypothetical protein H9P43_004029 [Blastocladiella emersonii ATCC 22665]